MSEAETHCRWCRVGCCQPTKLESFKIIYNLNSFLECRKETAWKVMNFVCKPQILTFFNQLFFKLYLKFSRSCFHDRGGILGG